MTQIKPLTEILGFTNGYITIFKGDQSLYEDWFKLNSSTRFHNEFKWYITSEETVPEDLPAGLTPVKLPKEKIFTDTGDLLPQKDRLYNIESLLYGESNSNYFGTVGSRYDFILHCIYIKTTQSYYGAQNFHVFEDKEGNVFTWNTTSRLLEKDKFYSCRGTVKSHFIYHNQKQTELNRLMSFKERGGFE